jgi:O-acetyl-ADP-ribose deacetylase (regulator of RNase III)
MNTVLTERVLPTSQIIQIVRGDLTAETTDAIVNAANSRLQHGAGVAGAIVRGGGQAIQQASDEWIRKHGAVTHAHPAWTEGGLLPAKYVIHAVGPMWGEGDEDSKLASAIHGSLEAADRLQLRSLSFPAISTGIFGFPRERAAGVMLTAIQNYFRSHPSGLLLVRLVLFEEATVRAFMGSWQAVDW